MLKRFGYDVVVFSKNQILSNGSFSILFFDGSVIEG